jgi:3-hydroxyisobutyrate dehydrogenase-like beta-hydroxyacid dehydrogenase
MTLAFLGLGRMGIGIAKQLAAKGHTLAVWNRTAGRAASLAEHARVATTIADAVVDAEIVFTMLADDRAAREVVEGNGGLLARMATGTIHVSLSTISVALARQLAAAHTGAGQGYVSAPVFGRPSAAESGQLLIAAAGPHDQLSRAMPALHDFSRQVVVLGERPEQANAMKLAGNFLIASAIEALAEAFAFAKRHDIEPATVLDTVNEGLLKSPIYKTYGTILAERQFSPPGFAMPLGLKDIRLVLEAADEARVPMPLASLIHDHLLSGLARGKGELDWSAFGEVVAENAGIGT